MRRINVDRINAGILLAIGLITSGCTTNRVTVDDHSYRVAPPQTTINNYIQQPVMTPPVPTIQQVDREFLQYQQSPVSMVPANYYMPQRTYPPIVPGGLYYPQRQVACNYVRPVTYRQPSCNSVSDQYRFRIKAQLGL